MGYGIRHKQGCTGTNNTGYPGGRRSRLVEHDTYTLPRNLVRIKKGVTVPGTTGNTNHKTAAARNGANEGIRNGVEEAYSAYKTFGRRKVSPNI